MAVNPIPGLLLAACLLAMLHGLDPQRSGIRAAEVAGVVAAFALFRPNLGEGSPRALVVGAALLRGAGRLVAGSDLRPALASALGGAMLAVFLLLTDLLTLRRSEDRRLYDFVAVAAIATPSWYLLALWLPHTDFPRPHLMPAVLGEAMAGSLLGLVAWLAAPRLPVPTWLETRPPAPAPAEPIEMDLGAGGAPGMAFALRATLPGPAGGTPPGAGTERPSGSPDPSARESGPSGSDP